MRMKKVRDQTYVVDLCDEVLGRKALREHRFDFLRSDTTRRMLPVDAYYPELKLVVEYHERQHTESVSFFNRTVAGGGSRDEQRRHYDDLRRRLLPENGLNLEILSYDEFEHSKSKRLRRNPSDRTVIEKRLARYTAAVTHE